MPEQLFDVAVIGGGHNGLVAAGYLAKAGLKTVVLEKNAIVGGFVTTEEFPEMPGFKFNLGALEPAFIRGTPILDELGVFKQGLEFLEPDPVFWFAFPDGKSWRLWRDPKRSAEDIRLIAGDHDADAFLEFVARYGPFWQLLGAAFMAPPVGFKDLMALLPEGAEGEEFIRNILMSANHLLDEWFDTDYVKAAAAKFVGTMGFDSRDQGTGLFASEIISMASMGRPKGGSGVLSQALAKSVESFGGTIRTNAKVERVLVENGKAVGVRLAGGEQIRAAAVLSQIDAIRLFTQLLDPAVVDPTLARRLRMLRKDRYTIVAAHFALSELPRYQEILPGIGHEVDAAALIICPSQAWNDEFQGDITNGRLTEHPVFWSVVHSVADPTLAPAGKHAMTAETYVPWRLADGTDWGVAKELLADRMVDQLAHYAPNIRQAIIARHVESPDDLVHRAGVLSGNIAHIDHQLCQMFGFRPLPELSKYRTPIAGLYLTGSGTHPMGAVTGMPGYNAAHEFLEDWRAGKVPRPLAAKV